MLTLCRWVNIENSLHGSIFDNSLDVFWGQDCPDLCVPTEWRVGHACCRVQGMLKQQTSYHLLASVAPCLSAICSSSLSQHPSRSCFHHSHFVSRRLSVLLLHPPSEYFNSFHFTHTMHFFPLISQLVRLFLFESDWLFYTWPYWGGTVRYWREHWCLWTLWAAHFPNNSLFVFRHHSCISSGISSFHSLSLST